MTENHKVVGHEEWIEARRTLLAEEKDFTRLRDQLSQKRRDLPWEVVDKEYVFESPNGRQTLGELFDGRSQLIVYHFMFDPDWDAGCEHCSFWADNFDRIVVHLNAVDVTMIAVSRTPLAQIAAYKKRMGWTFNWVSSFETDFNVDYGVSFPSDKIATGVLYNYTLQPTPVREMQGMSVFYKDEAGRLLHTYSAYSRGIDMVNAAYHYLDCVPKGRGEEGRDPQWWVRRHDEYGR